MKYYQLLQIMPEILTASLKQTDTIPPKPGYDSQKISRDYEVLRERMKTTQAYEGKEKQAEVQDIEATLQNIEPSVNTTEVKTDTTGKGKEKSEKEKILEYGQLADLSYVELKTAGIMKTPSFSSVVLDDASYPNLSKIMNGETELPLTPDEQKMIAFMNDPNNIAKIDIGEKIPPEYKSIIAHAGFPEGNIQTALNTIAPETGQIMPEEQYDFDILKKRSLFVSYLKQEGIVEAAKKNFEQLKQNFKITDYYPNETKQDDGSSGLGAVFLERDGKKYLAIRGTQFSSWADLVADGHMIVGSIPDKQVKDLIKFIDRNLKPGEKFSIVGHSLGGALSQIASAMYADQLQETYTFNAPGARKLSASDEDRKEFGKINKFMYNRDNPELQKKVVNVVGDKGISPIAGLGEDIGDYEIKLKSLDSHRITVLLDYVRNLDESSEELKRINVKRKEEGDRDKEE